MTGVYQRDGIHFLYPENWTLEDDGQGAFPRTISVQSPTGAFWSVDIHPFSVDPAELLEMALVAMRGEYPDLESTSIQTEIADAPAEGTDLYFVCLDFVVAAQMRALRHGHSTYMLTYQAEDRDFEKLQSVFQAVTLSFFQETDAPSA